mgnify:CR=1 FL=1
MKKKKKQKFSTWLVDQAIQRRRSLNEDLRRKMLERISESLNKLSMSIRFEKAYIFGSVAKKGQFREGSDVDIGFVGLEPENEIRTVAMLSDLLGIDVDVVLLEGHRLAQKIMRGILWKKPKRKF